MLYDILCPLCMRKYPANNVVFRHSAANVVASGRKLDDYRREDAYLKSYYARFGIVRQSRLAMKVVDPGYLPEHAKVYTNDMLVGVDSGTGYVLEDRLCPYCHNKLFANAGRMPMQQMALIGGTHSGKTTFESAMIYQLMQNGIGCINNTLSESANDQMVFDEVINRNIAILQRGDPARRKTDSDDAAEVKSLDGWNSTENYHGPYIYSLALGESETSTALAFYDLPGEHFRTNPEMVKRRAQYIGTAKTCMCLIDLDDIDTVATVISTLQASFGEKMRANGVNFALVLYKADLLTEKVDGLTRIVAPLTLSNHDSIDMNRVETASAELEKFVIPRSGQLQGAYNALKKLLGPDSVRLFVAQSFDRDGNFDPHGCDIPLLWSFARQGLYPKKV